MSKGNAIVGSYMSQPVSTTVHTTMQYTDEKTGEKFDLISMEHPTLGEIQIRLGDKGTIRMLGENVSHDARKGVRVEHFATPND